jgi:acyl carrier protein
MSNTELSRDEIRAKLIEMIGEVTEATVDITGSTSLLNELDIDSLTMVRLDILIQSNIGLALSADDLEDVDTVDQLVETLITRGQPVDDDDD